MAAVENYPGTKLTILTTSGERTREYAQEFYDVLYKVAHWDVSKPKVLPAFYDSLIDVQISTDNLSPARPEALALLKGLHDAGVKCRDLVTTDANVKRGLLVLWIGSKSPDNISPNDCAPVPFVVKPGDRKPCEFIRISKHTIPIVRY